MKIFNAKFYSLVIVFLAISIVAFPKIPNSSIYFNQENNKTFSVYFVNTIIKHSDEQKIKAAFMEKAHILDCNIEKRDGFVIFVIKTEREITRGNIITVLKKLGYTIDKSDKISIRQE